MKGFATIETTWTRSEITPEDGWVKSELQHDQGTVYGKWIGPLDGPLSVQNDMVDHVIESFPIWGLTKTIVGESFTILERTK